LTKHPQNLFHCHFTSAICSFFIRTKVCRYNCNSAGSLGWPFPMLKYKYVFLQIKYTEAILSNSTRKLLRFEISKMLIAVLEKKCIVSYIIIFGTLSFPCWWYSVYFIWKIYLYFSLGNGQPRKLALCQLYRHTFLPYCVTF